MKSFILIFVLIVSTECGLLDDIVSLKDEKPKSGVESNQTEYRQGVLIKVRETLKNGTKIVIDALGNVIRISPKENEENTNEKGTLESPRSTEEVVTKDEASEPDPKADLPTSTEKVKTPKVDESKNQTLSTEENAETKEAAGNVNNTTDTPASPRGTEEVVTKDEADEPDPKADLPTSTEKVEAPKVEESKNQTLSTEENATTKEVAGNVNNTTDTPNIDGNTSNNCTSTDGTDCGKIIHTKSAFKGDACPSGKKKADDGTCVEVV